MFERRHGAAQLVGLGRREARGDDGDLHRLFLKQWHAERLAEHIFELLRRIGDGLQSLAAAQIGMHHIALNGTGPHDRDLDDEIIEGRGLQPRQHRHLRPALDLEDADRVGARDHRVNGGLFGRQRRERQGLAIMLLDEVEALAQAGQHAERQHVDLQYAERVEIVLVPFDRGAVLHRGVHDRNNFVEPRAGDDEAACVLREMARKADQLLGEPQGLREARLGRIEPGLARRVSLDGGRRAAPDRACESADDILRKPEGLADVADGRACAIGDDARRQARPRAAVSIIDILHDFFAPLMLEIDVDIGRLIAIRRDEALEQKIVKGGIDFRDAETVTERRIRGGPAALAQNHRLPRTAKRTMS